MCVNPLSVPNPLYKRRGFASEFGQSVEISSDFSPKTEFIEVPCGKCAECRDSYFTSILQRAICECRSSYMYFVTLTYDDAHIPFIDLDDERILYADYSHIQNMVKRFRGSQLLDRDFRYLCVNEYGDNYSRPHFHLLFFVARRDGDDRLTPHRIERILYDNLKKYFSLNIGTRKHPIYEPLFTYAERITPFGIRTNYWVKYVENEDLSDYLAREDESSNIRAIRYLIGYVNTTTRIDRSIEKFLRVHAHDQILCDRVTRLLSNRLRFSKGFGCGFVDGEKFYLPKISVRASTNILLYSEMISNLPSKVDDFIELYPEEYDNLLDWIAEDRYSRYSSIEDTMSSFTQHDYYLHLLTIRYFPKHFSNHIRNLYKDDFVPTISAIFDSLRPYSYNLKRVETTAPLDSELYRFLRSGVDEGLRHGVPFLAFPIKSHQGYCALCKYYRDRVTTFEDVRALYNSLGVSTYDDWKELFIRSYNGRKADKAKGNEQKYRENSEIILQNQKKSLHLTRRKGDNLYSLLFVL